MSTRSAGTNTVFASSSLSVDIDDLTHPDGGGATHTVVTAGSGVGILVVPVARIGGLVHVGMVRQYRHPLGRTCLELPRGQADAHTPAEALAHLREELGVPGTRARRVGMVNPDSSLLNSEVSVWVVDVDEADAEPARAAGPGARLRWLPYAQVTGLVATGAVTCGPSLAALMQAEWAGAWAEPVDTRRDRPAGLAVAAAA